MKLDASVGFLLAFSLNLVFTLMKNYVAARITSYFILATTIVIFKARSFKLGLNAESIVAGLFYSILPHYFNLMILGLANEVSFIALNSMLIIPNLFTSIIEELYFRVLLYDTLKKSYFKTSLMFSLFHLSLYTFNEAILSLILVAFYFSLGIIFQVLYEKHGFAACSTSHIAFNIVASMYLVNLKYLCLAVIIFTTMATALIIKEIIYRY
ncbi:MAG: hypothetical protein DRN04_05040 [Thermoprotei archaeon]|nr:MAG: hypothetical protein DRN04_05040 [Thermoprotei archaeon]